MTKLSCEDDTLAVFLHHQFNNAKLLESIGLAVPFVTSVLLKLKKMGIEVDENCYTVDSAAKSILNSLAKGGGAKC